MTVDDGEVRERADGPFPIFWAPGQQPFIGSMIFRVGRADEQLHTCGITHLVEHLALSRMGRRPYTFNAWVEGAYTVFYATGRQDEVVSHLQEVARMLADLPLDRLENERRVLDSEDNTRGPTLEWRMLAMRFGPVGFGLLNHAELGAEWVGEEELRAWTAERFSLDNVAVWFNAEPPADFTLDLPQGRRHGPPAVEAIPTVRFPTHVSEGTGGVALSLMMERSTTANVAIGIFIERMHQRLREESGLSYGPNGSYLPLDDRVAHVMLNADCRDRDASRVRDLLLEILDDLGENGPTEEELAFDREMFARSLEDPDRMMHTADSHARNDLIGFERSLPAQLLEERAALTPGHVAPLVRESARSLMVLSPDDVPPPPRPGLSKYSPDSADAISGRVYATTSEWVAMKDHSKLEVSETAFRYDRGGGGNDDVITWRFSELVAGVRHLSGSLTIVGREGYWVKVVPHRYVNGIEAVTTLEQAVAGHIVPLGVRERALAELVDRELELLQVGFVADELDTLHTVLAHEETVRHLAQANRGEQLGLLVLTDRRVIFLFWGTQVRDLWEAPLDSARFSTQGLMRKRLVVEADGEKTEFKELRPQGRMDEILAAVK